MPALVSALSNLSSPPPRPLTTTSCLSLISAQSHLLFSCNRVPLPGATSCLFSQTHAASYLLTTWCPSLPHSRAPPDSHTISCPLPLSRMISCPSCPHTCPVVSRGPAPLPQHTHHPGGHQAGPAGRQGHHREAEGEEAGAYHLPAGLGTGQGDRYGARAQRGELDAGGAPTQPPVTAGVAPGPGCACAGCVTLDQSLSLSVPVSSSVKPGHRNISGRIKQMNTQGT